MSVDAFMKVWEQSRHGGTELLVMLALADVANQDSYVQASVEWLARRTRCTEEQLIHVIDYLVASGELRPVGDIECRLKLGHRSNDPCYRIMIGADAARPDEHRCNATYTKQAISPRLRAAILERDGRHCRHCGATEDLSIDHIVPERLGGTQDPDNLQVLCRSCNSRKGVRAI